MNVFFIISHKVIAELHANGVKIYDFPDCDEDEDEEFKELTKDLKVPFIFSRLFT